ncbi:MAG: hypothetical protein IPN49_00195 [Saprospiraceae bacterium]|nr:hypothetical protein [Saprospiraceae bacterium]MBK8817570.1 hypothetical protein [Saprospiraceae bacterium]
MNRLKYFFPALLAIFFSGCGLNDNVAPVPTYLIIKDPKVLKVNSTGEDTHKITDVWVYSDGQLQGIFPLPAKVPVISTGEESEILILAGIRKNGILDEPAFYPFYKAITANVKLEPLKEINIPITFQYSENCKFDVIADFEQVNLFEFDLDLDGKAGLNLSAEDASSGLKSGKIKLENANSVVEIGSTQLFEKLSIISGNAYIEMDYKGQAEIGIGLVTYDDLNVAGMLQYKVVVVPRDKWNKIYVDITDILSAPRLRSYRLAFGFTVPAGKETGEIYVDNIKLVRF